MYDPKHRIWLISYLFVDSSSVEGQSFKHGSAIVVSRSFDGGLTWSAPTIVSPAQSDDSGYDKPWMNCDTHVRSPFYGHCYMLCGRNPLCWVELRG